MNDNRTTELQSLSKLKKAGKLRYWRGTIEIPETELHAICDEIQAEHDQAITATLGKPTSAGLTELLDEFEHECFMLRVEASETRAGDDVVRKSYERIRDEFAGRIAATLGNPEIVRCRDCEHYNPHGVPTCQRNRECVTGYDINGEYGKWYDGEFYVEPDGFCAWAECKEVD